MFKNELPLGKCAQGNGEKLNCYYYQESLTPSTKKAARCRTAMEFTVPL